LCVLGYGLCDEPESLNIAHQAKKMHQDAVKIFRDRFHIPIDDKQLEGEDIDSVPYYHPGKDSPEVQYMLARRKELGGYLPHRRAKSSKTLSVPGLDTFEAITKGTGEREISTTMAIVRGMNLLLRDKEIAPHVVPIVVDEARTFGMEGMFRQIGIYAPGGQKYRPQDADQLLYYREAEDGQVLQEGISEAGGVSAWIAAGTSYSVSDQPMLPFYIFYSCFGFRRIGDLIWAAGDQRTRGFLLGATAGRSFAGEGLQHADGDSMLVAGVVPNCKSYDPTFSYEVAVIMQDGIRRMLHEQEDVFYYITAMNENYTHPDIPEDCAEGIIKGMYLLKAGAGDEGRGTGKGKSKGKSGSKAARVQLLACGVVLREAIKAAELLDKEFGVIADVWSCPSFTELSRDGFAAERWNRLHPDPKEQRKAYVAQCLEKHEGPVVAATDYVRAFADQVRAFVPHGRRFTVLGTDGYGRSDTRVNLLEFFEVNAHWIAHAATVSLAAEGVLTAKDVERAIKMWNLDPGKPNPITV
jgi:pyruvate dehydrogenase E1 component